jgi:hypothetical protein
MGLYPFESEATDTNVTIYLHVAPKLRILAADCTPQQFANTHDVSTGPFWKNGSHFLPVSSSEAL